MFSEIKSNANIFSEIPVQKIEKNKKNIVLIGMMKSGKTSVGKMLAEKTNMEFIDTDRHIEIEANKSIAEIFEQDGEDVFRKIESKVLIEVLESENQIISTGGGIVLSKQNREEIKNNSLSIWLFASPSVLACRENNTLRPLLKAENTELKLQELLEKRFPNYIECADLLIVTDNYPIDEITTKIHEEIY